MNICQNTKCKKSFEAKSNSKGTYCSRSCAAQVNNSISPKRKKKVKQKNCLQCSKELNAMQKVYCSNKCQQEKRRQNVIEPWLKGKINGSTKEGCVSSWIRNYLLEVNDNKCSRPECRWGIPNPYIGKVILTIEHIDGDIYNGYVDNIELLCWNCHTLTATFGSLNKGKGKRNSSGMRQWRSHGESNPAFRRDKPVY